MAGALVIDPRIQAVSFTGSRVGGLAPTEIARHWPKPIPVYAKMSSVHPAVLFWADARGASYVDSLIMGAGQF